MVTKLGLRQNRSDLCATDVNADATANMRNSFCALTSQVPLKLEEMLPLFADTEEVHFDGIHQVPEHQAREHELNKHLQITTTNHVHLVQ